MTAKVSVALVGAGHMGRLHAQTLAGSNDTRLDIVVDRHLDRAEALAGAVGCRASTRFEDVFTADAAIVATPPEAHFEAALALLDAGQAVLVEKPLAIELTEVQRLLEASQRVGVPLMGGFVERFNPAVTAGTRLFTETPALIVARRSAPAARPLTTPVALDLLIHDVDLALRFTGGSAVQDTVEFSTAGDRVVNCRLQFESGTIASLSATRSPLEPKRRTISLTGQDRVLHLDLLHRTVRICSTGRPADSAAVVPALGRDPLSAQLDHFLALHAERADAAAERAGLRAAHAIACRLSDRVTA